MKVWVVGKGRDARTFDDALEAYQYRGKLSRLNGHHKNIPIQEEQVPDYLTIAETLERLEKADEQDTK